MSDRPMTEGWWLASDGRWYPPELHPDATRPGTALPEYVPSDRPVAASVTGVTLSRGLTIATAITYYLTAVMAVAAAVVIVLERRAFDRALGGGPGTFQAWSDAEEASATMLGLTIILSFAAAVLFVIWMFKAYNAAAGRGAADRRWGPGWTIGAWFIPVAGLIIPKLVMNEIERMSSKDGGPLPIGTRWREARLSVVGHVWWALWVASLVAWSVGIGYTPLPEDALTQRDEYRFGLVLLVAAAATLAGAAAAAGRLIQIIGRRLEASRPMA